MTDVTFDKWKKIFINFFNCLTSDNIAVKHTSLNVLYLIHCMLLDKIKH